MNISELWNKFTAFFLDGYNAYLIVGIAVLVIVLIIVAVVLAKKKKRRAEYEKSATIEAQPAVKAAEPEPVRPEVIAEPKAAIEKPKAVQATPAEKLNKVVQVEPVEKKEKPVPPPAVPEAPAEPTREELEAIEEQKLKRPGVIQIYKDTGDKYRFRFKASNNETVGHSQGYIAKAACKNGIKAVQAIVNKAEIVDTLKTDYKVTIGVPTFEIYKDTENKFRFRLRAANTSNILASQGYTTKENCYNGIRSVKHIAFNHMLLDDTIDKAN